MGRSPSSSFARTVNHHPATRLRVRHANPATLAREATPTDVGAPQAIMTWVVVNGDGEWRIRAVRNTLVEDDRCPS